MTSPAEPSGGVAVMSDNAFQEIFEFLGALGEGAFSAVVKARHNADGQLVALKMTKKEGMALLEGPSGNVWAADEEAHIWRQIRHPNVVALLGVYNLPDFVVLSTELCSSSLLERLEGATDFVQEAQAQRLACQVVSAVLYLHSVGIAHRDLKPGNVLCTAAGAIERSSVKVADFGLASSFESGRAAVFQRVVGTTEYMAPELVAGMMASAKGEPHAPYDETVDLWAVGCLIYELLSGRPPFYSVARRKQQQLILSAPLEFPPLAFANVSDDAIELMRRLLDRDPAGRPAGNELAGHGWIVTMVEVRRSVHGPVPVLRDDEAVRAPKLLDKLAPVILCGARSSQAARTSQAGASRRHSHSSSLPGRASAATNASSAGWGQQQSERASGLSERTTTGSSGRSTGRSPPSPGQPGSPTPVNRRASGRLSARRQEDARAMGEMRRKRVKSRLRASISAAIAALRLAPKQTWPHADAAGRLSLGTSKGPCEVCAACFPR